MEKLRSDDVWLFAWLLAVAASLVLLSVNVSGIAHVESQSHGVNALQVQSN